MKIVKDSDVIQVWEGEDGLIHIVHTDPYSYCTNVSLAPVHAQELAMAIRDVCSETEYFKGLRSKCT